MAHVLAWAHAHRRVILLKVAVAVALAVTHFYPHSTVANLLVNLVWLFLF